EFNLIDVWTVIVEFEMIIMRKRREVELAHLGIIKTLSFLIVIKISFGKYTAVRNGGKHSKRCVMGDDENSFILVILFKLIEDIPYPISHGSPALSTFRRIRGPVFLLSHKV